jgi:CHAT domain-containing protein
MLARFWIGAVLAICLAPALAKAERLGPRALCRLSGAPPPVEGEGLAAQADAAEAVLARTSVPQGDRGEQALGLLAGADRGTSAPEPRALAKFCGAAGEAMRLARSGSVQQSQIYLFAAGRSANAAAAPELAAMAAYRLALASVGGGGGWFPQARGEPSSPPGSPKGCEPLAGPDLLVRPSRSIVVAALTCARQQARAAGDLQLAALAGLKLSRVQLAAAATQPAAAEALTTSARTDAVAALEDAANVATPDRAELLGRIMEAALDAGADATPPLERALSRLEAAAATAPDAEPYALALAGRVALLRGDVGAARGLIGRAVFLEGQRAQPLRQPTFLLWAAAAEPERRRELTAEAYRALEAVRPFLPLADPLTEEPIFTLRMQPVFEAAVDAQFRETVASPEADRIARVQEVVEAYRQAEVQSALGADCVPPREAVQPADLRPGEVLLYPILLQDRVELIYARGSASGAAVYRRLSPDRTADRNTVVRLVRELVASASALSGDGWREPARQLYHLLIKPIEGELAPGGTLVIVPDGPLRSAPFPALLDAEGRFLTQRTAVVVAPALSYSQPGLDRGRRPVAIVAASLEKPVELPAGVFAKLEGAGEEARVAVEVGGAGARSRLIRDFRRADLQRALSESKVDILHVATHAAFNGRSDRSFVVANDEAIPLSELRSLISAGRARGDELSLLVLSACETAVGDDQASMGLAGAAVQAGAQSALASLWEVDDVATVELMKAFYTAYRAGLGRAAALRQAQLKMLADGQGLEHPGIWSAFTLLGGWR